MRVAKATNDDIDRTREFLQFMEALFDSRTFRICGEGWENIFDEDSHECRLLKYNRQKIADGKGCHPSEVDDRLVIYESIKEMYRRCDLSWNRVITATDVLIDNVCDPSVKYLEYHPFIDRAMDNGFFGE